MPNRLTKIYTRTGDSGETQLGDKRLSKDETLVEIAGSLDELNAHIGFVLACDLKDANLQSILLRIQNELFDFGGELHLPNYPAMTANHVLALEEDLDRLNADLPHLKEFILPGGSLAASACHIARTVCRRAERRLVSLHRETPLKNAEMLRYVNRLSDLLFVIARVMNKASGQPETLWRGPNKKA